MFVLPLLLLVVSCSNDKLDPLPDNAVILAFGDSLTKGKGVSEVDSYPKVLSELSGRSVINAGISGEITTDGLARLPAVLDDTQPDLMILLEGGNDILRNINIQTTKSNLAAMIETAHGRGIPVILIGVPEKKLFSDSASIYPELADEHDLVFDEDLVADLLRNASFKSDAVHLNATGYRAMAEKIHELLNDNGAL